MPRRNIDERDDRDDERDDRQPDGPPPAETDALAPPNDPAFWHTYSPRFECPISHVAAALLIGLALLLFMLVKMISDLPPATYKPGPQMGMVDGSDETGQGMEGGGGDPNPAIVGQNTPTQQDIELILPDINTKLPEVSEQVNQQIKLEDPNSPLKMPDNKVAPLAALQKELRDKMLALGTPKGDGGPGRQGEGNNPTGKGDGTGSDSTRARTIRWVIIFRTNSGRDYLDQLQDLGAKVIVPMADGKSSMFFRDLSGNPPTGKVMAESDWPQLSGLLQFSDYTKITCEQVGPALGMGKLPKGFWAFFPKEREAEMARKEVGHQQRRSEDIEETKFEVVRRGGKCELVVVGQSLKK